MRVLHHPMGLFLNFNDDILFNIKPVICKRRI